MALDPEKISFLLQQVSNADLHTFQPSVAQLNSYLSTEVKDNQIYDFYEGERSKWKDWHPVNGVWTMPGTLDEAKSLAYDIYKSIGENDSQWAQSFALSLFNQRHYSDNFDRLNTSFLGYLELVLDEIIIANPEISREKPARINKSTVFIIHGHDNELKIELQLLLKRAGVENIVLHEQPDKGRSILDKLIEETKDSGYAIALLTPDDIMDAGQSRARQNVILEVGYFLGLLGKERIRMIIKGNVEVPSDLSGILYEKHDLSGGWKVKLIKELQAVGIHVDLQAVLAEF